VSEPKTEATLPPCPFAAWAHDAPGGCRAVDYDAGDTLTAQGGKPGAIWYLRSGSVALSHVDASGKETLRCVRQAESLVGLDALVGEVARSEIRALGPVVACRVSRAMAEKSLAETKPPIAGLVNGLLRELELRTEDDRMRRGRAATRLARYLLQSLRDGDDPARHALPRRMLAGLLDMRPETLSRAIATLCRSGLLEVAPRGRLVILDEAGLQAVASGP